MRSSTIWVLGDQLNRRIGALATADPSQHHIVMVESASALSRRRWHRQRLPQDGGLLPMAATHPRRPDGRRARVGDDACPFTTLYWDFLARHRERFDRHPRMARQVRAADRLTDLDTVRTHAVDIRRRLDEGRL